MGSKKILSKEEIEHLAKLSLINLSEEEKEKFSEQLNDILDYFQKLDELDTSNIEPTRHRMYLGKIYLENLSLKKKP
jgi:aspartyl-tRNA(Asn)/glutamyl-tRNA(Gln) amidotransferase subunit C